MKHFLNIFLMRIKNILKLRFVYIVKFTALIVVSLPAAQGYAQSQTQTQSMGTGFPDIIFQKSAGRDGFGRLSYSSLQKRYYLFEGRINNYVVDKNAIRPMRYREGGGVMANPETIVVMGNKLFGTSGYYQINEIDPITAEVKAKYNFSEFKFGGGFQPPLFVWGSHLVLINGEQIITLDQNLKKLSEAKLKSQPAHVRLPYEFVMDSGKLYAIDIDNPNTYTECVPECRHPTVLKHTVVDVTNPKNITATQSITEVDNQSYFVHKAILSNQGWLVVKNEHERKVQTVELRLFTNLKKPFASTTLPAGSTLLAMTKSTPIWMVLKLANDVHQLASIDLQGANLRINMFAMSWLKGSIPSFAMQTTADGKLLFVTSNNQLAIYNILNHPPQILYQQDFVNEVTGSSDLFLEHISLVRLPEQQGSTNRSRLESVLQDSYWGPSEHMIISNEIDKLRPQDKWALPLFLQLLGDESKSHNGGMTYSLRALEKFGTEAKAALPLLLKNNLGSSYSPKQREMAFVAIKKLDPSGTNTIPLINENLNDSSKVRATIELLEFIGSKETRALAQATRARWKI